MPDNDETPVVHFDEIREVHAGQDSFGERKSMDIGDRPTTPPPLDARPMGIPMSAVLQGRQGDNPSTTPTDPVPVAPSTE